ncbi:MAG: S41 family peptidase [Patescibacteria group bacterium]
MQRKLVKFLVLTLIVVGIGGTGYLFGLTVGQETPKTVLVQGVTGLEAGKTTAQVDFGVFWQAWDVINREYLKHDTINNQTKVYGAVRGLVQSLGDPYTQYFNPVDNNRFQQDVSGSFGGIGAELGLREDRLVVITPLKGSPASKVGLEAGDFIVSINSTSTENLQVDEAVNLIRGPENTTVTLSIYRESWGKIREISIKREKISVPTLDSEILSDHILYIQLYSFNAQASQLMAKALQDSFSKEPIGGIILDLRNNPGGYLEVAVDMAGWFLPKGTLVVTEQGITEKEEFLARGNGSLLKVPLVVIVNQGSASAAEILAGALRDHKRAELVGEQSFGKGTIQELKSLKDGSAIKMTIAHWVLPKGQILEGNGLVPDYVVKMPTSTTATASSTKADPQLLKAREILKAKITTLFKA